MHQEVGEIIPEADIESAPPKIQTRVAYAICELCMMFKVPSEAARYGSLIGAEVVYIRTNIYSKEAQLDEMEFGLQLAILNRISDAGSASASQILQDLTFEDYDCGEYLGWDE